MATDSLDEWLPICGGAKEEEEKPDAVDLKRRRKRLRCDVEDAETVTGPAPLYTDTGELTFWGLISRNCDPERRRQRRRADAEARTRDLEEERKRGERRAAILEETSGNEFLADLFSDTPIKAPVAQPSPLLDVSSETPSQEATDSQAPTAPEDGLKSETALPDLDIFETKNFIEDSSSFEFIGATDELSCILGGEVEVVEGNRVGRLNPFPGAYKKGKPRCWSLEETEVFYQGLAQFGADFMMIKNLLSRTLGTGDISERDIVSKFRKESKQNKKRIANLLIK
eukprot:Gregarina_sp_Pseudo_9__2461@NODE_2748_length_885_cov_17_120567_g2513_i0_p1_GENE_NODE_2748_length_885_cov_17_120567_g2513_i0NODE_2748_length_885_cov_17_120567_g2513_i0_p1_ORF_typecomplete_len284_score61_14Myb_DNAbind_7/PF15963_5/5_6e03Myb_DNAbind_7/PF15963_5/1e14MCM2_N/PF12619_8/4_8e02MCM2_N/PF12619_8/0_18MCM2_N/PF12619_8/2e03eIF3_subunit/PF08597_10/8_2e02eIF3_subunit/PF08597_10/0_45eIF3_subunit/PF08597_10/6_6e03_NODE_2748_length_885_cov_17_120567_g2513_i033884